MSIIGNTVRFLAGLAVGGAVGAITAVVLAPQAGETSRAQVQARLDEAVTAGRAAARRREGELYSAWEAEVSTMDAKKQARKGDAPPTDQDNEEVVAAQRERARRAAQEAEDKARQEAQKHLEQATSELDKARREVEKAQD